MMPRLIRAAPALAAAGGWLLAHGPAAAGELLVTPKVNQSLSYDDNVGLTTDNEISSWISRSEARLSTDFMTRATTLHLEGGASLLRYFDDSSLNTDNEDASFALTHTGQRSQLSLDGSFVRDTTTSSPLDIGGNPNELVNERRVTYTLTPSFSYQLTETQVVELNGSYQNRSYPSADEFSTVSDYSQYTAQLNWLKAIDPRTQLGIGTQGAYVDANTQQVSVASLVGILRWQVSPRLRYDLTVGPGLTTTDSKQPTGLGGSVSDSETTVTYYVDTNLNWLVTPLTTVSGGFTRSVEPYGTGQSAVTRNSFNLGGSHRLSRYLSIDFDGVYQIDQSVGNRSSNAASSGDITSIYASPALRWNVTKDIDLSVSYRLRYRSYENSDADALSQAVIFRVGLDFPEWRGNW